MALSPLILSLDVVWLAFRLSGKETAEQVPKEEKAIEVP